MISQTEHFPDHCLIPLSKYPAVTLAHGGGRLMQNLFLTMLKRFNVSREAAEIGRVTKGERSRILLKEGLDPDFANVKRRPAAAYMLTV
jgi:hypothetical protein